MHGGIDCSSSLCLYLKFSLQVKNTTVQPVSQAHGQSLIVLAATSSLSLRLDDCSSPPPLGRQSCVEPCILYSWSVLRTITLCVCAAHPQRSPRAIPKQLNPRSTTPCSIHPSNTSIYLPIYDVSNPVYLAGSLLIDPWTPPRRGSRNG